MILRWLIAFVVAWTIDGSHASSMTISAAPSFPSETSSVHKFALLFIHGLGGDPVTTFGDWWNVIKNDTSPLISEKSGNTQIEVRFSDFDVYFLQYETKTTALSIVGIGQDLEKEIEETNSLFRKYDMVFVVAHSLGGVVLHQAFNLLAARNHFVWFRFLPAVLELGVPVSGSELADAADKYPSEVTQWLGFNPKLVVELQTKSDLLDGLNTNWHELILGRSDADGWPLIYCGYEEKPLVSKTWLFAHQLVFAPVSGEVVPKIYSSSMCNGAAPTPIDADHIELTKVKTRTNGSHRLLRAMIEETLRKLETKRYKPEVGSDDLYTVLTRISNASASETAKDRDTLVPLYKERIRFSDPTNMTKNIAVNIRVSGWSIGDATRRLASTYPCLNVVEEDGVIDVTVVAGLNCSQ
jgi:hypothetical protein